MNRGVNYELWSKLWTMKQIVNRKVNWEPWIMNQTVNRELWNKL